MQIPQYFLRKAARQFGDAGPGWAEALPSLLARCQNQWQLTECVPADNLSINLICYARSATYGDVVLKIAGPHNERLTEIAALQLYAGRGACKCLEADLEIAAMLLERIIPGHTLRTLPNVRAKLEIGADLITRLPIPVCEDHAFPRYADWVNGALAMTRANEDMDARMLPLMAVAQEIFTEICPGNEPQALLHGDLHHDNMLQNQAGEWKAIDPQGVIGAPFMESARFIQNHAIDEKGLSLEVLDETVTYFAGLWALPKRVIGSAVYVLHTLSTCWGYQMANTPEMFTRQVDQIEQLLKYVKSV